MENEVEEQKKQAEIWLLTELNQAEENFGVGADIVAFAKKYYLREHSDGLARIEK